MPRALEPWRGDVVVPQAGWGNPPPCCSAGDVLALMAQLDAANARRQQAAANGSRGCSSMRRSAARTWS
jgi:hypothetical protein